MRCSEDSHCITDFACEAGFCVGSECTATNARDVCGPYACVRGLCAKTCSSAGCADGYYCRADTLLCVPTCTTREDPVCAGYLCDLTVGECEPYCLAGELACAQDYRCNAQSECVR